MTREWIDLQGENGDARVAADSPYGSGALAGSSLGLDPELDVLPVTVGAVARLPLAR